MNFTDMNLKPKLIQGLNDMGIISPTDIQEESIPIMLENPKTHVIGQAKTGSGKTIAFAIPIIEGINHNKKQVQAVIMVPTRELCKQITSVFKELTKHMYVHVVEVYGGTSINWQIKEIEGGAQIVVATPGRLIDLYKRKKIKFNRVKYVALDEADQMLDMGFIPDIRFILLKAMANVSPRLMLFSATLLKTIKKLVHDFTHDRNVIEINVSKDSAETLTVPDCVQTHYIVNNNKYWNFIKIFDKEDPEYSIIFTKTKRNAKKLFKRLANEHELDIRVAHISGDLTQAKREIVIKKFRNKELNCIIGTDVLARGLDFPRVTHVFNYDIPEDEKSYVHRIGRTARVAGAGKDVLPGRAVSLINHNQKGLLRRIEDYIRMEIPLKQVPSADEVRVTRKIEIENEKSIANNKKQAETNRSRKNRKSNNNYKMNSYSDPKNRRSNYKGSNRGGERPKSRYVSASENKSGYHNKTSNNRNSSNRNQTSTN